VLRHADRDDKQLLVVTQSHGCQELGDVQVSAPRLGKMTAHDAASSRVSIEPWPDRTLHPVLAEQALADGYDFYFEPDADDNDELEEPPSDYSRAGVLDTDLSSLQDVRLVAAAVASTSGRLANGHIPASHDEGSEPAAKSAGGGGAAPAEDGTAVRSQPGGDASADSHRGSEKGLPPPSSTASEQTVPPARTEACRGLGPPRPGASAGVPAGVPPAKGRLHAIAP